MSAPAVPDLGRAYARAVHHGYTGLEQWLAERLDAPAAAEAARLAGRTALAEAASWYASHGLPVLPLAPGAKIPLGGDCCWGSHRRGCRDASSNVDAARHWWTQHPYANVGLATGHVLDVIDVDGPAGWRAWLDGQRIRPLDVLGTVSTPRPGGVHRYLRVTGRGNGQAIAPGVDFRGRGGYCVAPPSWIRTPEYSGRYAWLTPLRLPTR